MDEYIKRQAFLEDVEKRYCLPCKEVGKDHNGCMCRACWVDDMRGEVIDAPAADVVPVSELLTLRDALYENDQITMRGLARLNVLIAKYGGYDHG